MGEGSTGCWLDDYNILFFFTGMAGDILCPHTLIPISLLLTFQPYFFFYHYFMVHIS